MITIQKYAGNNARRNLLIIISSTLFFACCHRGQFNEAQSDRRQDHLAGSVRSVRLEASKLIKQDGQYTEGPREVVVTKTYNSSGNLAEENYTTSIDAPLYNIRYSYDGDGRKSDRVIIDPKGATRAKREYKHDSKGSMDEWAEYDADDSLHARGSYTYDDKNGLIESATFNGKGALTDRWAYAYDEKGNRKEETRYFADDSIDTRYVYEFDENGNRIKVTKYNARGEVTGKESYAYEFDSNGNWIKQTTTRIIANGENSESEPIEVAYRKITYN